MLDEKALLLATRDRLRSVCEYTESQCEVEFDELAPGMVGEVYVIVAPAGYRSGRYQMTSGTVRDYVYSVAVTPILRVANVPRDRTRDVFLNNLESLDRHIQQICDAIDWSYDLVNAATELLVDYGDAAQGFIHPLVFDSVDQKPRIVSPDIFAATGTTQAGMARTIHFTGARRIRTVNV